EDDRAACHDRRTTCHLLAASSVWIAAVRRAVVFAELERVSTFPPPHPEGNPAVLRIADTQLERLQVAPDARRHGPPEPVIEPLADTHLAAVWREREIAGEQWLEVQNRSRGVAAGRRVDGAALMNDERFGRFLDVVETYRHVERLGLNAWRENQGAAAGEIIGRPAATDHDQSAGSRPRDSGSVPRRPVHRTLESGMWRAGRGREGHEFRA